MEWLTHVSQPEQMEVDIGFLPQMEIIASAPSQVLPPGADRKNTIVSASGM